MDAVILFSHGSLLCGAGEALEIHTERLRRSAVTPCVEAAYLNYSQPDLQTAVERCVAAGAGRIVVTPYFLTPGKFVSVDLPAAIEAAAARFPDTRFAVADAVGFDAALAQAIMESAREAAPAHRWNDSLSRVTDRCRAVSTCPLFGKCVPPAPSPPAPPPRTEEGGPDIGGYGRRNVERGEMLRSNVGRGDGQTALLVVAHGSPRAEANDDLLRVIGIIDGQRPFDLVRVGFLECNAPDIPEAIDRCVADGSARVIVAPYFLHTGTHVAIDIPDIMRAAALRHSGCELLLAPYIGLSDAVTGILIARTRSALRSADPALAPFEPANELLQ
jgi:sirohydrochlorin cobaltochelatase